ncbi:MAG TPA: hypothetical protein VFZ59_10230 [Verrucomicrobiae bacterium]|nr:hypothetical protein [Verrucomicrobiae bacterium]
MTAEAWKYNYQEDQATKYREAEQVLQVIGTNALPWLLQEIRYERPAWKGKLERQFGRLRYPLYGWANWLWDNVVNRNSQHRWLVGVAGLQVLGTRGSNAVPELERLLTCSTSSELRDRAMYGLLAVGDPGFLCLAAALENKEQLGREKIAYRLGATHAVNMETSKDQVVSVLVRCVDDNDRWVSYRAIEALQNLRTSPDSLIPKLVAKLHDADPLFRIRAAWMLGDYGERARVALPEISEGINDIDARVTWWCSNAVFRIAPEQLSMAGDDTAKH